MSDFTFVLPSRREELLSETGDGYVVQNVLVQGEIIGKLQEARLSLRDEGAAFILEYFDAYYSTLHHGKKFNIDVIFKAYQDLHKAMGELYAYLGFVLSDSDNLTEEVKTKTLNIMKMLVYIYVEYVCYLEDLKASQRTENLLKKSVTKKGKKCDDGYSIDKSKVLFVLNNVIQKEIALLWERPVVEEAFIKKVSDVCFTFLQDPGIKQEKDVRKDIFGVLGNLIKTHGYGTTFAIRIIQSIKMYEHVVQVVPDGVKVLVLQFSCKGLVPNLIREATEWQVDESYPDAQGAKQCSVFLTELAILMPDLVIPEVTYLNRYLTYNSVPLRSSVLNVMHEIILKVLTKHNMSEEETELRDELLGVIIEHIRDISAPVRSKVIQNLAKLQKENSLPLKFQQVVLEKVVQHLHDKAVLARKAAINCITVFLTHNLYGANLQLATFEQQLNQKTEELNAIESAYKDIRLAKIEEIDKEWQIIREDLQKALEEYLENEEDDDDDDDDDGGGGDEEADQEEAQGNSTSDKENADSNNVPQEQQTGGGEGRAVDQIRSFLKEKKFNEAFKVFQKYKKNNQTWKDLRATMKNEDDVTVYMQVFKIFFMDLTALVMELRTNAGMKAEDIERTKGLENSIQYLKDATEFLKLIASAMEPMKGLLFTTTVSDMNEAMQFFIQASKFQIDNASDGVQEMLKLMKCKEQERKDAVLEALREIFLVTDTNNMTDHAKTIVIRLIALWKEIYVDNLEDFEAIIAGWTSKGVLDNSVIDMLWQFFIRRTDCTEDQSHAAADLLRMAASGRKTVITKNLQVVTALVVDRGANNMLFLASCCRFLTTASREKIDITSDKPAFRMKHTDEFFTQLVDILVDKFFEPVDYYMSALSAAISFIYHLCTKPQVICEKLIKSVVEKVAEDTKEQEAFVIMRFCQLLSSICVHQLSFLDDTIYRELKRRENLRSKIKEDKKTNTKKTPKKRVTNASSAGRSTMDTTISSQSDETVMEGAQAEDGDAEFILEVLENNVVCNGGLLAHFASVIVCICQRPDIYDSVYIQGPAVDALIRYMLVSSKFCRQHIRLLFTIFEKTTYPDVKCSILIQCSDLLTRFPNVIEPWTPRIYDRLKDPMADVRKIAFFSLSTLILKDMIRVHSHISELAVCMVDADEEMAAMSKNFFIQLSQKDTGLSNTIPDIFTHLAKLETVTQENLRFIMKFLFNLVDKSKRMENLVDRFCCKFGMDDDVVYHRNIVYCLSLVSYNDKALKKLQEKFPTYKHLVHDGEVYNGLKEILAECKKVQKGKTDLKPIVTEIETCIESVFELDENGQAPKRPPPVPRSAKKKQQKAAKPPPKKKQKKRSGSDEEGSDASDESFQKPGPSKARAKSTRKGARRRVVDESDSSD